jgi:hypothetical protein
MLYDLRAEQTVVVIIIIIIIQMKNTPYLQEENLKENVIIVVSMDTGLELVG